MARYYISSGLSVLLLILLIMTAVGGVAYFYKKGEPVATDLPPQYSSLGTVGVGSATGTAPTLPQTGSSGVPQTTTQQQPTTNTTTTTNTTPVPTPINIITITSPNGGERIISGLTYDVTFTHRGAFSASGGDFKAELISATRLDRAPLLISAYADHVSRVPHVISWVVPESIDTNDEYRVRITYRNAAGTYTDLSDYPFRIVKVMTQEPINITADLPSITHVASSTKNIEVLRFFVTAPSNQDAVISELALGSSGSNEIFNYLENARVVTSNGTISSFVYTNDFHDGYPLYRLSNSLFVPRNTTYGFTIYMDMKPNVTSRSIPGLGLNGGVANAPLSGMVAGNTIIVD